MILALPNTITELKCDINTEQSGTEMSRLFRID